MRLSASVDTTGALRRLSALDQAAKVPRPILRAVADVRQAQQADYFATARWQPLTAVSAARKRRAGRAGRPLVGGALERSLTRKGARYSFRRFQTQSLVMGTRDPVAHLHDRGTRRGLPARPVVQLSRREAFDLTSAFRDGLIRQLTDGAPPRRLLP